MSDTGQHLIDKVKLERLLEQADKTHETTADDQLILHLTAGQIRTLRRMHRESDALIRQLDQENDDMREVLGEKLVEQHLKTKRKERGET